MGVVVDSLQGGVHLLDVGRRARQPAQPCIGVRRDGCQRLVDLVGDRSRHRSHRGQPGDAREFELIRAFSFARGGEFGQHFVEGDRQPPDLVVALVLDPQRVVLGLPYPRGELLQPLERLHDPAREKKVGDEGEEESHQKQDADAQDQGMERCIGFIDRQLDEHGPIQRCDRGIRRQHAAAVGIPGQLRRIWRLGELRPRCPHLGEIRQIGVAQHQADVRMRDQASPAVDHIGLSVLADLDLRDDVPDEFEVDLGHAHIGVARAQRDRHVRLRSAAKIHRAAIRLADLRLQELGVVGKVELAADFVQAQTRHPQLLVPGAVEQREVGDRGNLAQHHAPQIEAAPVRRGRGPRLMGGPCELLFDVPHELGDIARRLRRLLVLDADQRRLAVLIGEQNLERRVREQRDADDGGEDRDELRAQPPAESKKRRHVRDQRVDFRALDHSITLSARSIRAGGKARPSAVAVLRLTISSNLVGCSTGRSAGFAPLRMRPV